MFFEELVEQHRVHRLVAHGVDLSFGVASHEIGVDLFHVFSHETKLRDAIGVNLLLVAETPWFKRKDGFARLVDGLDLIFETLRGGCRAKLTGGVYFNGYACNSCSADAGDKRFRLSSRADTDGVGLGRNTLVTNIDIVTARREIVAGSYAQSDIAAAGGVASERIETAGRVKERVKTVGRVATAGVVKERLKTIGRVEVAGGV